MKDFLLDDDLDSTVAKLSGTYDDDAIKTLDPMQHIRLRPGMYIGRTGDGTNPQDGIYVMFKETVDNSIDEFKMGYGNRIDITLKDKNLTIRDYGRGIPLGKIKDTVSKINTSGKYDSETYQRTVGLNGVGSKVVNTLSSEFHCRSVRDGQFSEVKFQKGIFESENSGKIQDKTGTMFSFTPDDTIFKNFYFNYSFLEERIWNFCYLNTGLSIYFNDKEYRSENGLKDLLEKHVDKETIKYPVVQLKGKNLEIVFTHDNHYGESYYSYVNGQYTNDGGTHQQAFRESFVRTIRNFYKKDFDVQDIRASIIAAISVSIVEPVFESQTKNRLGSEEMVPDGIKIKKYFEEFMEVELDSYLHKNPEVASSLLTKILLSEKERKEISGIRKLVNERSKKANLHNKKIRDCKFHFNDKKKNEESTIFITEGDSASGSLTSVRDGDTQAVFSLKGKPLNSLGMSKKICYENEELNLLQHALGLDESYENLRFNKIVILTDADNDGFHICNLLLVFFAQYYPELLEHNHLYILKTPLFRVRNNKQTVYCYDEKERDISIKKLNASEVTRFKGLGEISPNEFGQFIDPDKMKLIPVPYTPDAKKLLDFYMGSNTQERADLVMSFIVEDGK